MKSIFCVFSTVVIASFADIICHAQTPTDQKTSNTQADSPYAVVQRDANSKTWERTTYEMGPSGKAIPQKHSYTELATGMNFLQNGQWIESQEQINILPDGSAAASQGEHQVSFPGDIYQGAVELVTPDGLHLVSRPVGLSYDDGTKTVFIAELKSSVGQLTSSNQIIYPDAFTDFKADVRYTYTKAGFEQDIVLHEQPPTPESYGLNPQTAHLQVLTEFFNAPEPSAAANAMYEKAGSSDVTLQFGQMKMIHGKAFSIDGSTQPTPLAGAVSVDKTWQHLDGRTFLVEAVPVQNIESQLQALPLAAAATVASLKNSNHKVSLARQLVPARPIQASTHSIQLAKADVKPTSGLVLDYTTVLSVVTNFTFQADTTYLVGGSSFEIEGTTTIEGGTVVKLATNSATFTLSYFGNIVCQTAPYRPAIFTVADDDSVGETISGSTGNPVNYAGAGISIYNNYGIALHDIRMSYLAYGLNIYASAAELDNLQAVNCTVPILQGWANVTINNALFYNIGNLAIGVTGGSPTVAGTQLTVHNCNNFANSSQISLTNCLFVTTTNISSGGGTLSTNAVTVLTSATGVFQSVGAGSHYLPAGSAYRDAGTTNIDPNVLASLSLRTTCSPLVYSNLTFSVSSNFSTQVIRDTNTPDLGYHYDPLDYVFGGVNARTNLTFTAGIAVGWFELPDSYANGYGISITNGMNVNFNGTVTMPCTFTRYGTVQEGGNGIWTDKSYPGGIVNQTVYVETNFPTLRATFTRFGHLAGEPGDFRDGSSGQPLAIKATHCEIWGSFGGYNILGTFTNCLLDRVGFWQGTSSSFPYEIFRNCTFHGGTFDVVHWEGGAPYWYTSVRNCAFDGTSISVDDPFGANPAYEDFDYNSYLTGADQLPNEGAHGFTIASYNWQSSWLGNFYLPSGSSLVNAGSMTADQVGLYHFTTQTNQIKETNSIVDIGYHYVALDANHLPVDTNTNGIPDYIEDANGNGLVDGGESPWNTSGNQGFNVFIIRPRQGAGMP